MRNCWNVSVFFFFFHCSQSALLTLRAHTDARTVAARVRVMEEETRRVRLLEQVARGLSPLIHALRTDEGIDTATPGEVWFRDPAAGGPTYLVSREAFEAIKHAWSSGIATKVDLARLLWVAVMQCEPVSELDVHEFRWGVCFSGRRDALVWALARVRVEDVDVVDD